MPTSDFELIMLNPYFYTYLTFMGVHNVSN